MFFLFMLLELYYISQRMLNSETRDTNVNKTMRLGINLFNNLQRILVFLFFSFGALD